MGHIKMKTKERFEDFISEYKKYLGQAFECIDELKKENRSGRVLNGSVRGFSKEGQTKVALNNLAVCLETRESVCVAVALCGASLKIGINRIDAGKGVLARLGVLKNIVREYELHRRIHQDGAFKDSAGDIFKYMADLGFEDNRSQEYHDRIKQEYHNRIIKILDVKEVREAIKAFDNSGNLFAESTSRDVHAKSTSRDVHAEISLLAWLSQEGIKKQIGISKFCCLKCSAYIYGLSLKGEIELIDIVTGPNNIAYGNWKLPKDFKSKDQGAETLEIAVGANAYRAIPNGKNGSKLIIEAIKVVEGFEYNPANRATTEITRRSSISSIHSIDIEPEGNE